MGLVFILFLFVSVIIIILNYILFLLFLKLHCHLQNVYKNVHKWLNMMSKNIVREFPQCSELEFVS